MNVDLQGQGERCPRCQLTADDIMADLCSHQWHASRRTAPLPEPPPPAGVRERSPETGEACTCGRSAVTVF